MYTKRQKPEDLNMFQILDAGGNVIATVTEAEADVLLSHLNL